MCHNVFTLRRLNAITTSWYCLPSRLLQISLPLGFSSFYKSVMAAINPDTNQTRQLAGPVTAKAQVQSVTEPASGATTLQLIRTADRINGEDV